MDSEALTGSLPNSLLPCTAKTMLAMFHMQRERTRSFKHHQVFFTFYQEDLPFSGSYFPVVKKPVCTAVFTMSRCAFSIPAHLVPYNFTLIPVSLPKIKEKCLLSIQTYAVFPLAFASTLTASRYLTPSKPKVQTPEEGIHGNSNCYSTCNCHKFLLFYSKSRQPC